MSADLLCPAVLLETFVDKAGTSLSSITVLQVHLCGSGSSRKSTAELGTALVFLVCACPALKTLSCKGHAFKFLRELGAACPQLLDLSLLGNEGQLYEVNKLVPHLPSIFAKLRSLVLDEIFNDLEAQNELVDMDVQLADMSGPGFQNLKRLHLPCYSFDYQSEWLCLPPGLEHLACSSLKCWPLIHTDGRHPLLQLCSLAITSSQVSLHPLAETLRAAPALQDFILDGWFQLNCVMSMSTFSDLSLLSEKADVKGLRDVHICIDCGGEDGFPVQPVLDNLPLMPGFLKVQIKSCKPGNLATLLKAFPDAEELTLDSMSDMDNLVLQEGIACTQVDTLTVRHCVKVSTAGLLALCQHLPKLKAVSCHGCPLIRRSDLKECEQLMKWHGSTAYFSHSSWFL